MLTASSDAIYLEDDGRLTIHHIDVDMRYQPTGSQTLVQVTYSAINPADLRRYHVGDSNFVAGYDWAGTAIEIGPLSPFKVGQKLFGLTMVEDHRPLPMGAHQDYMLACAEWTYSLPDGLDPVHAAGFPAAVQTSIDALFNMLGFAFPPAGLSGTSGANEAILIWGGGGCLGQAGIQLAKAAGFSPIITTASPRNHDFLKQLGATHCFDYRSTDVVERVRSALAGKKLWVVYDAVAVGLGWFGGLSAEEEAKVRAQYELSSPALARQCCDNESELRLAAVVPVPADKDPDWKFPLPYRAPEGVEIPQPKGIEISFKDMNPEWGNRMRAVREWMLEGGGRNWKPFNVRIVKGAEEGIAAIYEVYAGKAGGKKVVIEHPM